MSRIYGSFIGFIEPLSTLLFKTFTAFTNSLSAYFDIGVAFPISLEWSVVRRQFVALVSPFQGHVACRNLPLTGPHGWVGCTRLPARDLRNLSVQR